MTNCDCCGTTAKSDERTANGERDGEALGGPRSDGGVTDEVSVTDRPLPPAVARSMGVLFDTDDTPRTVGEWVAGVRAAATDAEWMPPRVRDLCHDADGKHLARTPTQTYRFTCVLDAFVLHALLDDPVSAESTVPGGDEVTARVTADGVDTDPESAVLSLGAAADPEEPDERGPAAAYGQTCPYIHAFPTEAAYEAWDESTPDGATTAIPLDEARALAVALVEGSDAA